MRSWSCSIVALRRRTRARLSCGWRLAAGGFGSPSPGVATNEDGRSCVGGVGQLAVGLSESFLLRIAQPWPCPRRTGSLACATRSAGVIGRRRLRARIAGLRQAGSKQRLRRRLLVGLGLCRARLQPLRRRPRQRPPRPSACLLREALAPRTDDGPVVERRILQRLHAALQARRCAAADLRARPSPGGRRRGRRGACRSSRASGPRNSRC